MSLVEQEALLKDGNIDLSKTLKVGDIFPRQKDIVGNSNTPINEYFFRVWFNNGSMEAGPYVNEGAANTARTNFISDTEPLTTIVVVGGTTTITETFSNGSQYQQTIVVAGGTTTVSVITKL